MQFCDKSAEVILSLLALSSIAVLCALTFFVFREGAPLIVRIGLGNFFSGDWRPLAGHFGIAFMMVGTALVSLGALTIGVPLALGCAIVLTEMVPPQLERVLKPMIEILAGIPSVVYGFIGVEILLPLIRQQFGGPGASGLAAALILGVMILPTILAISMDALSAVPQSYREGSLALGATQWQTIWRVVLPGARSGIVAAIILGTGRAVGETMAVLMVAGNAVQLPHSPLDPLRTLTANLALEMGYAAGDHRAALFASGIALFLIIMLINTVAGLARLRHGTRLGKNQRPPNGRKRALSAG